MQEGIVECKRIICQTYKLFKIGEILYSLNVLFKQYVLGVCLQWYGSLASRVVEVLQLQGDQRHNICGFLTKTKLAKADQLKVHGF